MRYLLVVGFACNVHRREPRARIFVDDQLIDEFLISPHKDTLTDARKLFYQNKHILQPFLSNDFMTTDIKNLPSLRFYEVEIDQTKNQLKLNIDIENNDNNNTNGFITKNTLLQLQSLYFFPYHKKILSYLDDIKIKNRIGKDYAWYRRNGNDFFNILFQTKWHGKNRQVVPSHLYNIGGSGYFCCELLKKYGIFIPKISKSWKFSMIKNMEFYFINKYEQHANQRNSN
jgi:hypothetical protein